MNGSLPAAGALGLATLSWQEPPMTDARPPGYSSDYEQERPDGRGEPPRPAQEPKGSEGSSNSGETAVDPATGEPNPGAGAPPAG